MSYLKNLNKALTDFGRNVISKSRSNLTRKKKKVTGNLYKNLTYQVKEAGSSVYVIFDLGDYGNFVDKGVKGADPSIIDKWTKGRLKGKQKAPLSPYSYKSKYPPIKPLSEWAKKKNIRLRDAKGRFVRGNYKSIGYVLSKFIFAQGIKPSYFFTNPYNVSKKKLPEKAAKAFVFDLVEDIRDAFNKQKQK
tara:strand:- start:9325 stop:9897 length:573 start_codon:yes stop_codon:yes gene_type:complete